MLYSTYVRHATIYIVCARINKNNVYFSVFTVNILNAGMFLILSRSWKILHFKTEMWKLLNLHFQRSLMSKRYSSGSLLTSLKLLKSSLLKVSFNTWFFDENIIYNLKVSITQWTRFRNVYYIVNAIYTSSTEFYNGTKTRVNTQYDPYTTAGPKLQTACIVYIIMCTQFVINITTWMLISFVIWIILWYRWINLQYNIYTDRNKLLY